MSIETKSDAEHHRGYISNGLAGLKLDRDYENSSNTPELAQFRRYLNNTKEFILPPGLSEDQKIMNDTLSKLKEAVQKNNISEAINHSQILFDKLNEIHEKI